MTTTYVIRNRQTGKLQRCLSNTVVVTFDTLEEALNAADNQSVRDLPDTGGVWEGCTLYEAIEDPRVDLGMQMYEAAKNSNPDGFAATFVKLLYL